MIYGSAVLRYVGEIDYFPVNLPLSGNFLETIPAQTASTAIYMLLYYKNRGF